MTEKTLKALLVGQKSKITNCLGPEQAGVYRLLEMGLTKGAPVEVLRKSPLSDAIEIAINGTRLCISNELAKYFLVEQENDEGTI